MPKCHISTSNYLLKIDVILSSKNISFRNNKFCNSSKSVGDHIAVIRYLNIYIYISCGCDIYG